MKNNAVNEVFNIVDPKRKDEHTVYFLKIGF